MYIDSVFDQGAMGTFVNGEIFIGDDKIRVKLDNGAEP